VLTTCSSRLSDGVRLVGRDVEEARFGGSLSFFTSAFSTFSGVGMRSSSAIRR
jgi:hypothetical protein